MATQQHLIPVPGLTRVGPDDAPAWDLHLDGGIWRASCTGLRVRAGRGTTPGPGRAKGSSPALPHLSGPKGDVVGPPAPGGPLP
jgi:hypothetical protein